MNDYLWKIRCPESGYLIGDCGCMYCFDEFEMDTDEYAYLEEDLPEDEDFWDLPFDEWLDDNEENEEYDE